MRILAIETVDTTGSLAALDDDAVLVECPLDATKRSARSLAPGIAGLLERVGWRPVDVELVAVASGPGSFTGLRIGVTTAKTFAYAVGCQVIGVETLSAIASRMPAEIERFQAVLDAQRSELFVADFERAAGGPPRVLVETHIVGAEGWLAGLSAGQVVTGPALERLAGRLPVGVVAVAETLWRPTAGAIGRVGRQAYGAGRRDDPFGLLPRYFRQTAAEEQWERKHAPPIANKSS